MRILGIDPGSVRIGLAISDPDRRIASPLATYERRDAKQDAAYFKKVVAEEEIAAIVIGLPTREDGYEGEQAKIVRAFGAWLAETTGVPCQFYDERYTTAAAESALLEAGLTKKQRQARRDRVAAQMLLQAYLDAAAVGEPKPSNESNSRDISH